MNEADLHLWTRIVESSPVLVLFLLTAVGVLWKHNVDRSAAFEKLLREVLTAFNNNTQAIEELRRAIDYNKHR